MYLYLASAKLSAFFKSEKQDPGFPLEVPSEKRCNACSASLPFQVFSLLCHNAVREGGGDVFSFGEARMPMACIRAF